MARFAFINILGTVLNTVDTEAIRTETFAFLDNQCKLFKVTRYDNSI
jgi:hypothetical protein